MPETNDIDSLLRMLNQDGWENYHAALTALVAERNALLGRVAEQDADIKALAASNAILHGRLEAHPPADRDRELRERLVCAALTGVCSLEGWVRPEDIANHVVGIANATLAAMRKGEQP